MTALYSHAGDDQKAKAIAALPALSFVEGPAVTFGMKNGHMKRRSKKS